MWFDAFTFCGLQYSQRFVWSVDCVARNSWIHITFDNLFVFTDSSWAIFFGFERIARYREWKYENINEFTNIEWTIWSLLRSGKKWMRSLLRQSRAKNQIHDKHHPVRITCDSYIVFVPVRTSSLPMVHGKLHSWICVLILFILVIVESFDRFLFHSTFSIFTFCSEGPHLRWTIPCVEHCWFCMVRSALRALLFSFARCPVCWSDSCYTWRPFSWTSNRCFLK